jgi:hypothetical protein
VQGALRRPLSFASRTSAPYEASTRAPDPLQLHLPGRRRRYDGLALSLLIHALLVGLAVRTGDRLWSRTLAPGDPALLGGGGGGGGGGSRVAYITLPPPAAPTMPRQMPVTLPPRPRVEPTPPVTPPAPEPGAG